MESEGCDTVSVHKYIIVAIEKEKRWELRPIQWDTSYGLPRNEMLICEQEKKTETAFV